MKAMKFIGCFTILLWSPSSPAGGVLEMSAAAGGDSEAVVMERIYAQDGQLRLDTLDGNGNVSMSMIFRDAELLQIGHVDRSFTRINESTFADIMSKSGMAAGNMAAASGQMAEAMTQMKEQLASLPPEQRQMMEKMMQQNMPQLAQIPGMGAEPPRIEVEELGPGEWKSYSCTRYRVQLDASNHHELCAADAEQIEGGEDVREAFDAMREFHRKMMEALPQLPFGNPMAQLPAVMGEIEGFPVYRKEFNQGRLLGERYLTSDEERDLGDGIFAVPEGYEEESLGL
jgi:hypothetical protein